MIGGTLFIGRALVDQLLARGDDVVIMHRGRGTPFSNRVSEIRCDRNDIPAVQAALQNQKFDVVYDNVYDWQRGTTADPVAVAAIAAPSALRLPLRLHVQRRRLRPRLRLRRARSAHTLHRHLRLPAQQSRERARALRAPPGAGTDGHQLHPAFVYGPHNPFDRKLAFLVVGKSYAALIARGL